VGWPNRGTLVITEEEPMFWMLVACGGQANQCEKADKYVHWVDEDGTTEAMRDIEETDYEPSDCGSAPDPHYEPSDELEAACGKWWDAFETLDTCSNECELEETETWLECDGACRQAATEDHGAHTDTTAWALCSQDCPDQPTWECE
jgi:hypothetical protein